MYRLGIIIGLLGLVLLGRFFFFFKDAPVLIDGEDISFETRLFSQPEQKGKFQSFSIHLAHGERIFISTTPYPAYTYADTLMISGKLHMVKTDRGMIYTMRFPTIERQAPSLDVISLVLPLRERIISLFRHSLSEPESSLLLGMTFGIAQEMPEDFEKVLQQAGVVHVIAASGMNVTMVALLLTTVLGRVMKRQYSLFLSIIAVFLYAVLSGLSASIVRAAIMGSLVFGAQLLGRQTLALYVLLITGFGMLFFQPFLLWDTGFQLSFVATWGLIMFSPLVQASIKNDSMFAKLIAETDFSTSIIAQMVTLPIILGTFGSYSVSSIFTNMLVLWMVPLLMIIGGIGTISGLFIPVLGSGVLYASLPFLLFFKEVVWFFGSLPVVFSLDHLPWPITVGYYVLLVAVWVHVKQKRVAKD